MKKTLTIFETGKVRHKIRDIIATYHNSKFSPEDKMKLKKNFTGVQGAVFLKRGRRPPSSPYNCIGISSEQGNEKKVCFFCTFFQRIINKHPLVAEGKSNIKGVEEI